MSFDPKITAWRFLCVIPVRCVLALPRQRRMHWAHVCLLKKPSHVDPSQGTGQSQVAQKSANLFCDGPARRCRQLCGPYSITATQLCHQSTKIAVNERSGTSSVSFAQTVLASWAWAQLLCDSDSMSQSRKNTPHISLISGSHFMP